MLERPHTCRLRGSNVQSLPVECIWVSIQTAKRYNLNSSHTALFFNVIYGGSLRESGLYLDNSKCNY